MAKTKERKAGDPCPQCKTELIPDPKHDSAFLIERKTRNAANPAAAQRFAQAVTEKVNEHGELHMCPACGYRERVKINGKAAA